MCRLAIFTNDGSVDEMLLQIAPLYGVAQYMLCRPALRRDNQARRVLVVRDSPSEAQYWLQQDVHRGATIDYVRQTELARVAETLRDDEYLIIWEPAASWFKEEYDLQLLPDTKFVFLISLLVSARWVAQYGSDRVHMFYTAFRGQWVAANQDRRKMLRLLACDANYLRAFCSSMGISPL